MEELSIEQKIKFIEQTESFGDIKQAWFPPSVSDGYYFVSYCHKDYKQVFKDIYLMQAKPEPIAVWYDRELSAGKDWRIEAERHIYDFNCKGVIFYISENSVMSPAVFKEMQLVCESDKPFLPIVLPICGEYMSGSELFKKLNAELGDDSLERALYEKMFGKDITYIKYSDPAEAKLKLIRKSLIGQPLLELAYAETRKNYLFKTDYGACPTVVACNNNSIVDLSARDFMFDGNDGRPETAQIIGECAFAHCKQLKSIELPSGLKKIGSNAFLNCRNLKAVSIPNKVYEIGNRAFYNCLSLESVTLPHGCFKIEHSAFYSCKSLKSVTVPQELTYIPSYAFALCTALENIDLSGIERISDNAFYGCESLKNIVLSDKLTSIESRAFAFCKSLTNAEIPNGVTKLGDGIFEACTSLKSIKLPENISSITDRMFANCYALTEFCIPSGVNSIGSAAFVDCFNMKKISLPDGLTQIGDRAFAGSGIQKAELPSSVERIPEKAFCACASLYSVKADGAKYIGRLAFLECESLSYLEFPSSLTEIDFGAFGKCDALKTVRLPRSLKAIGGSAFRDCDALEHIYYDGTKDEWGAIDKGDGWDYHTGDYTVHCSDGEARKR